MNIKDLFTRLFAILLGAIAILILWKIVMFLLVALGWTPAEGAADVND